MDADWMQLRRGASLGERMVGLAKAAAALHMAEASRHRAHMLRPGDPGFEWSGTLTISEFEAVFGLGCVSPAGSMP